MKAEDFEPYKGKELTAETSDGEQVDLTLEEVDRFEAKGVENIEGIRSEPFTLIFSGPKKQEVSNQTVDIQLGDSGETQKLFIKLLNKKDDRIIYEVIVN